MAQILGPEGGGVLTPQEKRRSLPAQASRDRSRRGSRESLDSCQYEVGDEVSSYYLTYIDCLVGLHFFGHSITLF